MEEGCIESIEKAIAGQTTLLLTRSSEVDTVNPFDIWEVPAPVVNWPGPKAIFDCPTARVALAVVHTIFSGVPAINAQPDRVPWPELGCNASTPVGLGPPEK